MPFQYSVPRFSGPEFYYVHVRAPDFSILPTGETLPPDGFLIGFRVRDNHKYYYYNAERGEWILSRISFGSVHTDLSFLASRDETLIPVQPEISRMLDEVIYVPMAVQANFIQMIQEILVPIAINPAYASPRVVPILVEITTWYSHDESNTLSSLSHDYVDLNVAITDGLNDLLNLSLEEHVPIATPAARSAIESLPKVNLDAVDYQQRACSICLEDFLQDDQLISMPCNHAFHEECIKNWLQNSNLCPLCRFEMPVDPGE